MPKPSKIKPKSLPSGIPAFGPTLKRLRTLRGFTQYDLAEEIGVSRKKVSDWEAERSRPNEYEIKLLCISLKVSADTLLGLKEISGLDKPISIRWSKRIKLLEELPEDRKKILIKIIDDFIGY